MPVNTSKKSTEKKIIKTYTTCQKLIIGIIKILMFLKEVSYVHQGSIYWINNANSLCFKILIIINNYFKY